MKPFLRQQLERYPVRLQELDFFLSQPDVVSDMDRFRALTREHAEVSDVAGRFAAFVSREKDLADAREMLDDPDLAQMAQEEIEFLQPDRIALELLTEKRFHEVPLDQAGLSARVGPGARRQIDSGMHPGLARWSARHGGGN